MLLAVVADPVRWRLLQELVRGPGRRICNLRSDAVADQMLLHYLTVLCEFGLVRAERRRCCTRYSVEDDALERLHGALPVSPGNGVRRAGHVPSRRPRTSVRAGTPRDCR